LYIPFLKEETKKERERKEERKKERNEEKKEKRNPKGRICAEDYLGHLIYVVSQELCGCGGFLSIL
jgi:hypothetical protein